MDAEHTASARTTLRASLRERLAERRRRVRTETVLQMEAVECGAASLSIILRHFGRTVPLERLRVECNVSRDGTKASNIVAAARSFGLEGRGFSMTTAAIRRATFPAIIHWNFNHFLVLEGFGVGCAYLNDPARGRCVVSDAEFDRAFTGVVLLFERTPAFVTGSEKRGVLPALARRAAHSRSAIAFVLLASLGLVVPGLAIPAFTTVFVDDVLVQRLRTHFAPLLLLMTVVMLLNAGFSWLQSRYLLRLQTKLSVVGSGTFLWHVLHLPLAFFEQRFSGDIAARVGSNDRLAGLVAGKLAGALLAAITASFYLTLMVLYDGALALVALGSAASSLAIEALVARRRADANRRLLQDSGKLEGVTQNGLQMIESLKASGAESDFYRRWVGHFVRVLGAKQLIGAQSATFSALPGVLHAINATAILTLGALRVIDGQMTIGMLVAFQFLQQGFLRPVVVLVGLGVDFQVAAGDLERLDDILSHEWAPGLAPTSPHADGAGPVRRLTATGVEWPGPPKLEGHIELRDVSFGYSRREAPLLSDFSLTVPPGGWVALVGRSGCGKSTIAQLLCGLYAPWSGTILLDGWDRRAIPRAVLADSLAVVDQDIVLFSDSIRANITMWDRTVPHADVVRAAMDARIHDVITARPQGSDGAVAERGENFSGGQRQRLEIARALAASPSVLILDEATSALDATTERLVMQGLRRRGCTCLVVAHRLSTIRECDEIIVLDRGRIVERGTHDALLARRGAYAELIDDQVHAGAHGRDGVEAAV
jgi:NHLM bacteriocin system ABC transporter peptidase/ATP-binding protein